MVASTASGSETALAAAGEAIHFALLEQRDKRTGWNVLHLLAALGRAHELATLLALFAPATAPLEAQGPLGRTPLEVAVAFRNGECARVLRRAAALWALPLSAAKDKVRGAISKEKTPPRDGPPVATGQTAVLVGAVTALRDRMLVAG